MTEGRTAGEFPRGVPISGLGGMKGVAGSESGMIVECWISLFPRVQLLSHTKRRLKTKKRSGNESTHEETRVGTRALLQYFVRTCDRGNFCFLREERKDKIKLSRNALCVAGMPFEREMKGTWGDNFSLISLGKGLIRLGHACE